MASSSRVDSPPLVLGRFNKRSNTDQMADRENVKQLKMNADLQDVDSSDDPGTPGSLGNDDEDSISLQEELLSCLRASKEHNALGQPELELLSVASFMKQNVLPEEFLLKYMGKQVEAATKVALNNLHVCRFLQQQEVGKSWTMTSIHQDKIKNLISRSKHGNRIKADILERALKVLILELDNRNEGHLPYSSYIQDLIVSGMEIWENVLQFENLAAKYSDNLCDFALASYDEMPTPGICILFSTKTIRQLSRHFGQNDLKALKMKMCMTSIQARNGKSQQALAEVDEYAQLMETSDDINVRALLVTALQKKAFILKNEEKNCDEALKVCDKILSLDKNQFKVNNFQILNVKLFKCKVLNSVGQFNAALDICDEILPETTNVESLQDFALDVQFVIVEIYLSMEKYDLALKHIDEIISKRTLLHGSKHSSVLEAKTQKSEILEEMGRLDNALEELNCLLKVNEEKYGSSHIKSMHTKSNIARVLACKGQRIEATKLLNNMLETLTLKYGPNSREIIQFLEFKAHILRVSTVTQSSPGNSNSVNNPPHQLSFQETLNIYKELKKYYILKYDLSNYDSSEMIENVFLNHYRQGNWNGALADAQWIFDKIREELGENHQGLEHPLAIMAEAYCNLKDLENELRCQEMLYRVRMLNYGETSADTLNTLTRVAKLQIELKKCPNALASYQIIYKLSVPAFGEVHEKSVRALYKVASLQLKILFYAEALQNFEKVSDLLRRDECEIFDELNAKTKYKIALCHLKLANVEEARTLSKELCDEFCWKHNEPNFKYVQLYEFCQNIYERQKKSRGRHGKYFPRYRYGKPYP